MAIPTGVLSRLCAGVALPLRGLGYLAARRPLWAYAALPIVITLAGLVAGLVLAAPLSGFVLDLMWARPGGVLAGAWWAARAALYLVLVYVAAVALPVAVSAPFADQLSERVEALELGHPGSGRPGGFARAAAETWAGVAHGLVRLGWLVLGHTLLLPTLLVPLAYPVLAFLWTARWTAVEYLDLPMARNLHRMAEVKAALRSVRPLGFGFGGALAASFLVPLANLLVVPVGAVAGTLLYCELVKAGAVARPLPAAPPGAEHRAEAG